MPLFSHAVQPRHHRPTRLSRALAPVTATLLCGALLIGLAPGGSSTGMAASLQAGTATTQANAEVSTEVSAVVAEFTAAKRAEQPWGASPFLGGGPLAQAEAEQTGDSDWNDGDSRTSQPNDQAAQSAEGLTAATGDAAADAWIDTAAGTVELIVYFEDAGVAAAAQGDAELAAAALQEDADAHWQTVEQRLAGLEATGRVTVLNRFWISNAVLVAAEPSEPTIAALAALPGAIEVTPNYTVEPLEDIVIEEAPVESLPAEVPPAAETPAATPPATTPPASSAQEADSERETVPEDLGQTGNVTAAAAAGDATAAADDFDAAAAAAAEPPLTYGLEKIGADDVWRDFGAQGQGVRVAVLDTGVDATHPDLGPRLVGRDSGDPSYPGGWINFDRTGKPIVSKPTDPGSHGTHVAGTVLGGSASGTSIGVAPQAELMAANVLSGGGSTAKILAALEWVVSPYDGTGKPAGRAADVINMSLGSGGFEHQLARAIQNVRDAGIFPAIAIGNKAGTTSAPGNYYNSVAVGMTNADDVVDGDSSGGVLTWGASLRSQHDWIDWPDSYVKPDISAPGVQVYSAMPGGTHGNATGTSMATPHVAGAVALIRSAQAGLTVTEIEEALERTAWRPEGASAGPDIKYGHGRIDVHAAITALLGESGVKGRILNATTGRPVAGATVSYGERGETWTTDAAGRFTARLVPGTYTLSVERFGYTAAHTAAIAVTADSFATTELRLAPITTGTLSGVVLNHADGTPLAGATVTVMGQPLTATTDAVGAYRFDGLPVGSYRIRASAAGKADSLSADAPVRAALTTKVNFRLAALSKVLVLGDNGGRTSALLSENSFLVESAATVPADLSTLGSYDAVLWDDPIGKTNQQDPANPLAVTAQDLQAAIAATDKQGTGMLWLDLGASQRSGIASLSSLLGIPPQRTAENDRTASAIGYRITASHEIFASGLLNPDEITPGSIVLQNTAETGPKFASWFAFTGEHQPQVLAETVVQHTDASSGKRVTTTEARGAGIAVDERANNRHVFLALHGSTAAVDARNWSLPSAQLLLGAVKWAAPATVTAPDPEIVVPQPPVIKPGDGGNGNGTKPPKPTTPTTQTGGNGATPPPAPVQGVAQAGGGSGAQAKKSAPKPTTKPAAPFASERELTASNAGDVKVRIDGGIAHVTIPGAQPGSWYFLHVYPSKTPVNWIRVNDEGELRIDIAKLAGGTYRFAFTAADESFAGWVEVVVPGAASRAAQTGAGTADLTDAPTALPMGITAAQPDGLTLSTTEQLMLLGSALLVLAAAGVVLLSTRRKGTAAAQVLAASAVTQAPAAQATPAQAAPAQAAPAQAAPAGPAATSPAQSGETGAGA